MGSEDCYSGDDSDGKIWKDSWGRIRIADLEGKYRLADLDSDIA